MRVIRLKEVIHKTSIGRSTIYAMINEGTFPAPIKLGPHMSAWVESEVDKWIQDKIDASRKAA